MTAVNPITLRAPARSMGLKLLLVCVIALVMAIPAVFVFAILSERTQRAGEVNREIGQLVGGPQAFAGPMLGVPFTYVTADAEGKDRTVSSVFVIFPKTADAAAQTKTSMRQRGLFKTPVWTADLVLKSHFDLTGIEDRLPAGAVMDWPRAEFLTAVNSSRGSKADLKLDVAGRSEVMTLTQLSNDLHPSQPPGDTQHTGDGAPGMRVFGAAAGDLAKPGAIFDAAASVRFSGAQSLAVLAYGQTTRLAVSGDWPDPSYSGDFAREGETGEDSKAAGGANGYAATWSVPFMARGVAAEGEAAVLSDLSRTAMRVSFVEAANPYQAVSRSLKYAPMFLGLVFLAYFLFETTQKKRVHPAQYVLIGLAQLIFYLLLLAIAERAGFDIGFAIAAGATVALISAYAGWVFNRRQGFVALAAFTALYGLIYVLMRLQDWALLVGAGTSFAAIATVMYCTRNIDWYGGASLETKPAVRED